MWLVSKTGHAGNRSDSMSLVPTVQKAGRAGWARLWPSSLNHTPVDLHTSESYWETWFAWKTKAGVWYVSLQVHEIRLLMCSSVDLWMQVYLFIRYWTLSWTTASLWSSSRLNRLSSIPRDLKNQHKNQLPTRTNHTLLVPDHHTAHLQTQILDLASWFCTIGGNCWWSPTRTNLLA